MHRRERPARRVEFLTAPEYIGRYRIDGLIGLGAFAEVFEAVDEELEARVAIKILLGEFVDNDDLTERFTREGRLLRRVNNPHVVAVHDIGLLDDRRPYLVLDLADRGTLQDRLVTMEPSCAGPESVRALVDALAAGLGAMHAQDVAHRDVKPANLLIRSHAQGRRRDPGGGPRADVGDYPLVADDEILQLGDLGLAKDLDQSDLPSMLGGTPGYQAPEQRIAGASIGPPVDVYAATVILWRVLTWSPMPDAEDPHRFDSVDLSWARFFDRGVAAEPADRFQSMTQWRSAVLEALEHEPSELSITGFTELDPLVTLECPYKGLAPFQVGDQDQFVGREDLIDDLVERTAPGRVLVVGGPSGSGKSSLLRAGLIPTVQQRMEARADGGRVVLMVPGREPLAELAYRLSTAETTISADALRDEPRHARRAVAGFGAMLLVVDQFEELFTLCPDHEERIAFLSVLEALTDSFDSTTGVAIGIRSDFYSACARYQWLADRINDNQLLVGPMSSEDLRRAIVEPAERAGVQVETTLVDRVLADGGTDVGSLPLVSHALLETWSRRSGSRMLLEDYEAVGGVAGAIAKTADDVLDQRLTDDERRAARRLLLRMVTPGEGTSDNRRRIERAELDHDPEPDTMHRVVPELTSARLLTADDQYIEIAHEALIRSWPRMQAWLAEARLDGFSSSDPSLAADVGIVTEALRMAGSLQPAIDNLECLLATV
ncbi:MAG: serine/threonine-protein kinase, partial [Acidimicrobiales bacterium]